MSVIASASLEYRNRPKDERFPSLDAMIANAVTDKNLSAERSFRWSDLSAAVGPTGSDVRIASARGQATLTHWSFGQLSRAFGAPAGYLRDLPAALAVDCLNHGIRSRAAERVNLLLKVGGPSGAPIVRSITSDSYARVWDAELYGTIAQTIAERDASWSLPPTWSGEPAGAYRGDRDSFLILTNGGSIVTDPSLQSSGDAGKMYRGLLVRNSEVGAASITIEQILYRYVCGNHMLWGAVVARQFRRRHVGRSLTRDTIAEIGRIAFDWSHRSTERDTAILRALVTTEVGADRDACVTFLRSLGATAEQAEQAYSLCVEQESQLSPRSYWGLAQGLTRASQLSGYQDDRFQIDRVAGQLLARGARLVAA